MDMTLKRWNLVVIVGGVVGLSLLLVADLLTCLFPTWYSYSSEVLLAMLARVALVYLMLRYWFIALGFVALVGWYFDLTRE